MAARRASAIALRDGMRSGFQASACRLAVRGVPHACVFAAVFLAGATDNDPCPQN